MLKLGSETLRVIHALIVSDAFDNSQTLDWANATTLTYTGCAFQPFLMSNKLIVEDQLQRDFTREFLRIWTPPAVPIDYRDRIVWVNADGAGNDITMDVFGPAQMFKTLGGIPHHQQLVGEVRRG